MQYRITSLLVNKTKHVFLYSLSEQISVQMILQWYGIKQFRKSFHMRFWPCASYTVSTEIWIYGYTDDIANVFPMFTNFQGCMR